MVPKELVQLITTAGQFHEVGKFAEAEGLYRKVLAADPYRVEAMCGLGLLLSQQGRHEEAIRFLPWEQVWNSSSPLLLTALGSSMLAMGGVDGAVESAARAVELNGGFSQAHNLLGCALLARGQWEHAIQSFVGAIKTQPGYVDAYFNLATALSHGGLYAEADGVFADVLRMQPKHAKALLNRGFVLRELGKLDAAQASFQKALEVRPGFGEALHNLGTILAEKGRVHEGIAEIRRALDVNPRNYHAHSAIVYLMNFDPACGAKELAAEAAVWAERHVRGAGVMGGAMVLRNERVPERRLKIGYVSPDFKAHAESWFLLPLLEAHDRAGFEVHCYSSVRRPDSVTAKIRGLAAQWHEVGRLSDGQLAEKICADGIDVLVDLTMHMEQHRLLTFARRPAPVQVAWLGYPAGTGLAGVGGMTHRITDRHLVPEVGGGVENGYGEKVLRMGDSWFCYSAMENAPEVGALPMGEKGEVTFGSLNTYRKMSREVLELWAEALGAVQATGRKVRLVMACPEGDHRAEVLEIFADRGIGAGQVELVGRMKYEEYLGTYGRIDMGLDPFPHNGATTTCEALWMGVPVLTLAGDTEPGRLGVSVLSTVGLEEWIAWSRGEFLEKCVALGGDSTHLANLRATMRDRMRSSALMDAQKFARGFEGLIRGAWREWCRS